MAMPRVSSYGRLFGHKWSRCGGLMHIVEGSTGPPPSQSGTPGWRAASGCGHLQTGSSIVDVFWRWFYAYLTIPDIQMMWWTSVLLLIVSEYLSGLQALITVAVTYLTLQLPRHWTTKDWTIFSRSAPPSLPSITAWSALLSWWGQTSQIYNL